MNIQDFKERLETIQPGSWEKFWNNYVSNRKSVSRETTEKDLENTLGRWGLNTLGYSFNWKGSPEGREYWKSLDRKLAKSSF